MGRCERPRGAARRAAEVVLALLLAGPAAAQAAPGYWQDFTAWRAELARDAATTLAQWGEKASPRLLWLHAYVTADRPAAEFDAFLGQDALATLQLLHSHLRGQRDTDLGGVLAGDLRLAEQLKAAGRFDTAIALATEVLGWLPDNRPERPEFLLQVAECQRRSYRWAEAARALTEAARLVRSDTAAAVPLTVQRAALLLARGMPDLAVAEVETAERLADDPWLAAQALFVRLRLEHALRRPERAVALLRAFLATAVPDQVAGSSAWRARLAQLQIRTALAVLADPSEPSADASGATQWLRQALADPATAVDERILARSVLVSHLLDRGLLDDVPAELATATRELPAGSPAELDERRLALATLALRHARLAHAPRDEQRVLATELGRLWHLLVDRWQDQPTSRIGESPLFFGDCRRALVELLRAHLDGPDPAACADDALREVVRATTAGSLARQLGAGAPEPAAIRSALCRDGAGVLVFVPGHESSIVLALEGSRVTVHVLEAGALQIDRERRSLLRSLEAARQGEPPAAMAEAAHQCAALLLPAPVTERLSAWHSVAIVGSESLGYLPFEMLPGPRGERLGASHAVSYLPSLAVGVWLATHRPPAAPGERAARVRMIACPDAQAPADAAERTTPLAFADADLDALRTACRGVEFDVRHGTAATRAAGFAGAGSIDLLQILAHGIRDETRADPQGILLGDGTITWPGDLEALACPPYLFLSVCRAGRGRLRRGDDGRHLFSGAAMLAGARGVVLPVADVGYRATLRFAADVHRSLWQDGVGVAEALRRARVAADAHADGDSTDAFLFHLVGLGDAPLAIATTGSPAVARSFAGSAVLAAVVAALAAAWLIRRRGAANASRS